MKNKIRELMRSGWWIDAVTYAGNGLGWFIAHKRPEEKKEKDKKEEASNE